MTSDNINIDQTGGEWTCHRRQNLWWPNIDEHIGNMSSTCLTLVLQAIRSHASPYGRSPELIGHLVESLLQKQIQECIKDYEMGVDEVSDSESDSGGMSDSDVSEDEM